MGTQKHPLKPAQESADKLMATVFWDNTKILLILCMPHKATINESSYVTKIKNLRKQLLRKDEESWAINFAIPRQRDPSHI